MDNVFENDELRHALKLILAPTHDILSTLNEERRELPFVRELIEHILFSRRFVPTYLAVLTITILAWTATQKVSRSLTKQRNDLREQHSQEVSPSVASSSSSTLQGTESPVSKDDGVCERSPLIHVEESVVRTTVSAPRRVWLRLRSFLLRQPKPIASLTAPKNTLPANELSFAVLIFLALNLVYLFYRTPLSLSYAFAFADRAGLLFVVNLPVLYILAAKNNQPLCWITGWSYEGLNVFHRRLAEWITCAAILHVTGMTIGFYQLLAPSGYTLWWYLTRKIIIDGLIGFASYLSIYGTSIGYFRRSSYEVFLALHILLQTLGLVMLFFHHHHARPYIGSALAVWILDRLVSRLLCKTLSCVATLEVAKDKETVLIQCEIAVRHHWWGLGIRHGWCAGQHVFLSVPDIGHLYRFQAHPFTIASPAPSREGYWPLQLTIRAQDGFSKELLEYAKLHQHARVLLDGPYSGTEVSKVVSSAKRVCLIAGGSGIAVTYPFAWLRLVGDSSILHDRALYAGGRKLLPNIAVLPMSTGESQFAHIWIRQVVQHESWIRMRPSTKALSCQDLPVTATGMAIANSGSALDLVTHRFETQTETGQHHRPDIGVELTSWVYGKAEKVDKGDSICVVVSGPDSLVRDIRNTVASLVQDGWHIEIHVEKFGW